MAAQGARRQKGTFTKATLPPPVVTIEATDPWADEVGPDTGTFTVTRTGGNTSLPLTVYYRTAGTATPGSDYQSLDGWVQIQQGNNSANITLTPAGRAFLQEARRILADTQAAVEIAQRAARGEIGRLRIGYIGALSDGLIPRLLRTFRGKFPHVAASLQHLRPARQIAALLAKQLDLGFVGQPNPEYEMQLVFEVFRRDPMEVVLPAGHVLLDRKRLRLADLAKEKFVLLTRAGSPFHYDWLLRLCHEAGFHPDIVQEVEFAQTAVELVAAGYGVALFPATAQSRARDDVVFRVLAGLPAYEHSVAWRREDDSPAREGFLDLLREETRAEPFARQATPGGGQSSLPALKSVPRTDFSSRWIANGFPFAIAAFPPGGQPANRLIHRLAAVLYFA